MKNHYLLYTKAVERWLDNAIDLLDNQTDFNIRMFVNRDIFKNDFNEPGDWGHYASWFIFAYYSKGQKYYRDNRLLELSYKLLIIQKDYYNDDGSIDLVCTNFHDPNTTGFLVSDAYLPMLRCFELYSEHSSGEDKLFDFVLELTKFSAEALINLGFHTANHRWVISSALAAVYRYLNDERCKEHLDRFLMEGIDCDKNGEYSERSTGMYNVICNKAFIRLGIMTGDDSFFEYPRRNLHLVKSFIDYDGCMSTYNSIRQDNGSRVRFDFYCAEMVFIALLYNDSEMAYFSDRVYDIYEESFNKGETPIHFDMIGNLLMVPELIDKFDEIESVRPNRDQTRYLEESEVARIYRPNLNATITILANRNPNFLRIQYGSHYLYLRKACAFFGQPHSEFRPEKMEKTENGFRLISVEKAGYRSQLTEKPDTWEWRKMDHSKREIINIQELKTVIDFEIKEDTILVDVETSGCDSVKSRFEIVVDPNNCRVDTNEICTFTRPGDYILLKEGSALVSYRDGLGFEIFGGHYKHSFAKEMRGALPVDLGSLTFAMTDETPSKRHYEIKLNRNEYKKRLYI